MVIVKWAIKSKYSSKYLSKNKWGHVRSARLFSQQSGAEAHAKMKGFLIGLECEIVPVQTFSLDGPMLPPNSLFGSVLSLTSLRSKYYNENGVDVGIIPEQCMYGVIDWNWMDATPRLRNLDRSDKSKTFTLSLQDTLETERYLYLPVQRISTNFICWVLTHYGVEYDGVVYAKVRKEVDWAKPEKL